MTLLTPEQMYKLDKKTMDDFGIPSRVLMENAGKGCADYININYPDKLDVSVVCSTGNNGGDGFVIARWLHSYGYNCTVYVIGDESKFSEETRENYSLLSKLKIQVINIKDEEGWKANRLPLLTSQLIIDSIFGIGFKGEIRGIAKQIVESINRVKAIVISIDIPSGLNALTGKTAICVKADETLTMASLKTGHILGDGMIYCGKTTVIPIGIPKTYFFEENPVVLVNDECVSLPARNKVSHKGSYGRIAIIAGSKGYTGAAIMSCQSALKSGAGLITLFHRKELSNIFEVTLKEVMTKEIPEENGMPDTYKLISLLENYDAILFGPGIGNNEYSKHILEEMIVKIDRPVVIDADGLNILSENSHLMNQLAYKDIILTPHIGEFGRLAGISVKDVIDNKIDVLKNFVNNYKVKVLLKDSTTVFMDGESTYINISGNDGLSTGGSGDVLAGIIVSFIGQRVPLSEAPISASWLLGTTAEKINRVKETNSITPSDIIDNLFVR